MEQLVDSVLVTGAFGLVGSAVMRRLSADGRRVVATDLDTHANRRVAAGLAASVPVHYADLTHPAAVDALIRAVKPAVIIHLAAVIPPFCYSRRELARQVNVDATRHLVTTAADQPVPARFVLASSIAVYGVRNPHTVTGLLTADTPVKPADIYGDHKVQAEQLVRDSGLDAVILRLGGVLTVEPGSYANLDNAYFESLLPADGRLQTVDVRDVAAAFAAASTADVAGETLLIGGDDTHRQIQGNVASAMAAAMGLAGGVSAGLPGNPDRDEDWYHTDWMDCRRAQELLDYQRHSWPQLLAEVAERAGAKRHLLRLAAPLARVLLQRRSAYYGSGRQYADPWGAIAAKWGDPRP